MVNAIEKELRERKDFLSQVNTVYFGGGTPSLLSSLELNTLFNAINKHYRIAENAEITLEANPEDIREETLELWKALGINRLSIGCQTFDDGILKKLNRNHDASTAKNAFVLARKKGFDNISIDLMFGLPDQTEAHWLNDLDTVLSMYPEHVSAYGLTIEEDTVFGHLAKKGKLDVPNDEFQARYYEHMMTKLGNKGYDQYEISNFCLPGYHSRHNSSYWQQEAYLGIGPSAHSFDGQHRMWNHSNNMLYITDIESGKTVFSIEKLSATNLVNEYILTSLRTKSGLNIQKIVSEMGYPENKLLELVQWLEQNKWITLTNDQIHLTSSGKLLADEITLKFFLH